MSNGQILSPYPNLGQDTYLNRCSLGGNPFAAILSGDMRAPMLTTYGMDNTQVNILDGLSNLGVSKFHYYMWLATCLLLGYNGRITPDIVNVIGGVPLVVDLAANQQSPVLGWEIESKVPLNTTTPDPILMVDALADRRGQTYTTQVQFNPCKYVGRIFKFAFSVVQTAIGGANTCDIAPAVDFSGIPIAQDTGAFIPAGQIPVSTRTLTGLNGTSITIRFHGLTSLAVQQLLKGSFEIMSDALVPTLAGKVKDYMGRLFDGYAHRVDQTLKGNTLPPVQPTLSDIGRSPLVQEVMNYERPMVTVDRNIGNGAGVWAGEGGRIPAGVHY